MKVALPSSPRNGTDLFKIALSDRPLDREDIAMVFRELSFAVLADKSGPLRRSLLRIISFTRGNETLPVTQCVDGEAAEMALHAAREQTDTGLLMLSNKLVRGHKGVELFEKYGEALQPHVRVLMSGYMPDECSQLLKDGRLDLAIDKPYDNDLLRRGIAGAYLKKRFGEVKREEPSK